MERREIKNLQGLQQLAFDWCPLQLGVKSENCQGRWMELDETELRMLAIVLTRSIAGQPPLAQCSAALRTLAEYCASGAQFLAARTAA